MWYRLDGNWKWTIHYQRIVLVIAESPLSKMVLFVAVVAVAVVVVVVVVVV